MTTPPARPLLPLLALMVGVLAACEPRGVPANREDQDVLPETVAADAVASEVAEAPGGLLPGEGPPRVYRMLLVNPLDVPVHVFATAGAGRVSVDTVPAHDSVLVDIRVRADVVLLEAHDARGALLHGEEATLGRDRTNRWVIGRNTTERVTTSAPDSLF